MFRRFTVCLALLWTIDTTETDAFSAVIVQDFDGIAVENSDDSSWKVGECRGSEGERQKQRQYGESQTSEQLGTFTYSFGSLHA